MSHIPKKAIEALEQSVDEWSDSDRWPERTYDGKGMQRREDFRDGFMTAYTYRDAEVAELVAALEFYAFGRGNGVISGVEYFENADVYLGKRAAEVLAKWKVGRE